MSIIYVLLIALVSIHANVACHTVPAVNKRMKNQLEGHNGIYISAKAQQSPLINSNRSSNKTCAPSQTSDLSVSQC